MEGYIQIQFEMFDGERKYADALYFPENAVPDEATIEAMKQERFNNWLAFVNRPPEPVPSKYKRDQNGNLILDENGEPIPNKIEFDIYGRIISGG